jgi:hypothetical protein
VQFNCFAEERVETSSISLGLATGECMERECQDKNDAPNEQDHSIGQAQGDPIDLSLNFRAKVE